MPALDRLVSPARALAVLPAPVQQAWWALATGTNHRALLCALARRPDRCARVAAGAAAHARAVVAAARPRVCPIREPYPLWPRREFADPRAGLRPTTGGDYRPGLDPRCLGYFVELATFGDQWLASQLASRADLPVRYLRQLVPHLTRTDAARAWRRLAARAPFRASSDDGLAALSLMTRLYGFNPTLVREVFVDPGAVAAGLLPAPGRQLTEALTAGQEALVEVAVASGLLTSATIATLPLGSVLPPAPASPSAFSPWSGVLAAALGHVPALVAADAGTWSHLLTLAATHPQLPLGAATSLAFDPAAVAAPS